MQHFYKSIQGWFTFPKLYSRIVMEAKENSTFVEIGSWLGQSSAYMAVDIINSGKKIKFDCVDTWLGSAEHENSSEVLDKTLYEKFLKNIEPVKHIINPIRMPSLEASATYEDSTLDFVFIDASHDYHNVINDIYAWYPKVKSGAVLAGHDYAFPGVEKAVNEFLQKENYNLDIKNELCWGLVKR